DFAPGRTPARVRGQPRLDGAAARPAAHLSPPCARRPRNNRRLVDPANGHLAGTRPLVGALDGEVLTVRRESHRCFETPLSGLLSTKRIALPQKRFDGRAMGPSPVSICGFARQSPIGGRRAVAAGVGWEEKPK